MSKLVIYFGVVNLFTEYVAVIVCLFRRRS